MNRRKARENAFIALFEASFGGEMNEIIKYGRVEASEYAVDPFGEGLIRLYYEHSEEVEEKITAKLKGWTLSRLPKVSIAVLRLSVTEMLYGQPDMESVVINEAVELSKKFGDDSDYQFINGLLGSLARERHANSEKTEIKTPDEAPVEVSAQTEC